MKKLLMLIVIISAFALLFLKTEKPQDLSNMNASLVAKLSESPVAVEVFSLNEDAVEV